MSRFVSRMLAVFLIYAFQRVITGVLDISDGGCALIMTSVVYASLLDLNNRFERHEREGKEDEV